MLPFEAMSGKFCRIGNGGSMRSISLVAVLLAVAPAAAWSAETVAVVGTGSCEDSALVDQVRTVREALARKLGAGVLTEDQTVLPLGGLPRGSLVGAKRLVDQAESTIFNDAAMSRAEFLQRDQKAQELLQNGYETLLSIPPSSERSQILFKLHTLQLQLYSGGGRRAELEQALEAVFRVVPNFTFDPNTYSPPQLAEYEQVRKKLQDKSRATLKVTTRPAGLVVFVDGHEMGPAPLTLKLPSGTYRVEVASGAHRGMAHLVKLGDWAEVDIEGEFERSVQLDGGPCVAGTTFEDRAGKLGRFGGLVGAKTVVGVRAEHLPSGEVYVVAEAVEASVGPKRNGVAMKLVDGKPAPGALTKFWDVLGSQKGPLQILPPDSAFLAAVPAPAPPRPGWMRPAAWVSGGLAIGLAGFGTAEMLSSKSSSDKANGLVQQGGTVAPADKAAYDKATADADSAKKSGFIGLGGAGAFTVATIVFAILSHEPGPPAIHF